MKPNYNNICRRNNDGYIKLGIMNLAQENLYMLKRLTEKKSEYSVKKMEQDYKRVQNYKKIKCNFPCINFSKPRRGFSSDSKYDSSEKNPFLPTINYINDGYLEKLEKKAKDKKKQKENKIGKKLFINRDNNNHIKNNIMENKERQNKKIIAENRNESDNEKIINISRNELDNKDKHL